MLSKNEMLLKVKNFIQNKKASSRIIDSNNYIVLEPFLFGAQLENRKLDKYVFVRETVDNKAQLKGLNFLSVDIANNDYIKSDDIFTLVSENLLYNKEFNILLSMVKENIWDTLNTCINIGESSSDDFSSKRLVTVNAFMELTGKEKPVKKTRR